METRRAVFEVLCRVPEPVRAFALDRCAFASVGRGAAGMAISPVASGGTTWTIVLADRDGVTGTAAHELAHAFLGHDQASVEAEIAAAELAASWGIVGDSADASGCAERFKAWAAQVMDLRARVDDGRVMVECKCGAQGTILAPVVVGRSAECAISCPACEWVLVIELADLVKCAACGGRAIVTWAKGATPDAPTALWICPCGVNVTRRLLPNVVRPGPMPETEWRMRRAARACMTAEECLRRLGSLEALDPLALEGCRSGIGWARMLTVEAAEHLDARRALLDHVALDLTSAAQAFGRREMLSAADLVANAGHTLNAALAEMIERHA